MALHRRWVGAARAFHGCLPSFGRVHCKTSCPLYWCFRALLCHLLCLLRGYRGRVHRWEEVQMALIDGLMGVDNHQHRLMRTRDCQLKTHAPWSTSEGAPACAVLGREEDWRCGISQWATTTTGLMGADKGEEMQQALGWNGQIADERYGLLGLLTTGATLIHLHFSDCGAHFLHLPHTSLHVGRVHATVICYRCAHRAGSSIKILMDVWQQFTL